jgi:hypothetical protein
MVAKILENMSVRIFKNSENQELFDKQGFIVLPFLEHNEIQELLQYFHQTHPNLEGNRFFSDSYCSDFEFKKQASDKITEVFSRAFAAHFIDYQTFGASFLFKTPGENSELAAHQDWTIVDETKDIALNCWVPLCDIDDKNGALMVLPGSHFGNFPSLRAPTLPFFFSGNEDVVLMNLIPMFVKAGTAVVLNQSVIHYSQPNFSAQIRPAITAGIKNQNAQMFFHYKVPGENKLEVFQQNDSFLIEFENFPKDILERPKIGESIGFIPFDAPNYSANEVSQIVKSMLTKAGYKFKESQNETSSSSIFQRILSVFSHK